jgi:hypothetical protein
MTSNTLEPIDPRDAYELYLADYYSLRTPTDSTRSRLYHMSSCDILTVDVTGNALIHRLRYLSVV